LSLSLEIIEMYQYCKQNLSRSSTVKRDKKTTAVVDFRCSTLDCTTANIA